MPTVPTSAWSQSIDKVRDTFSNVQAFMDWTVLATPALAKARNHVESKPKSGLIYPFLILIERSAEYRIPTGSFFSGSVECFFQATNTETVGTPDEIYFLKNPVGLIIEGFMDLAGAANNAGYVSDPRFSLVQSPRFGSEGELVAEGNIMFCRWLLSWGTP